MLGAVQLAEQQVAGVLRRGGSHSANALVCTVFVIAFV